MQPGDDRAVARLSAMLLVIGTLLVVTGAVGFVAHAVPGVPVAGFGLGFDFDLELLGIGVGAVGLLASRTRSASTEVVPSDEQPPIHVTRPLLETLLRSASRSEPEALSIGLTTIPAGRLVGADDVTETVPVFTHRYLPERPNSVSTVFGVDLQTPPGRIQGRFVTHPQSDLRLTKRDDLHAIVLVAVPPWDRDSVAAFDRYGRRHPLQVVDAVPPDDSVPGEKR